MKKQSFIFDFDTFYVNTIYFLYINDGRSINHCCELASFDRCVEKEGDFIRIKIEKIKRRLIVFDDKPYWTGSLRT